MDKLTLDFQAPLLDVVANGFGYSTHTKMLKKYAESYFDFDNSSEIALHIIPADKFIPVAGKINVLFTMWEFLQIPQSYIDSLNKADVIVVPSRFCKDLFRKYTDKPIYVCHLGVEADKFPLFDRAEDFNKVVHQQKKFRFLWLGAPNPRKGYQLVLEMTKVFEKSPNVEIYLKTTSPVMDRAEALRTIWKNRKKLLNTTDGKNWIKECIGRLRNDKEGKEKYGMPLTDTVTAFGKYENIIYDTRKLDLPDLVALYNSAHCFLLPTLGEGWGLTLCEALATGSPAIATNVTGVSDFFNTDIGYDLKYDIVEQDLAVYKIKANGYVPEAQDLLDKMIYVISHYQEAYKKGLKASARIHSRFTWEHTAKRLHDIVKEIKTKCYAN